MTTASAPTGDPVRGDTRPSGLDGRPSRDRANRMRDPAVAGPRPLAKGLIVAPGVVGASRPAPTKLLARSPSGELEPANALTPAASVPKPSVWARMTTR